MFNRNDHEFLAGFDHIADTHATTSFTEHRDIGTFQRTAGGVLAVGSLLLVIGGVLHPPGASEMGLIADNMLRWGVSHWLFAAGTFVVGVGGLLVLLARSDLAADWATVTSWAAVVLGAVLATVFLLGEATVLPQLAAAGESTRFPAWRTFIEMGVIASLLPVSGGLLVVAGRQARHPEPLTPTWAAWGGVLAFLIGILWIVGFGFLRIAALGPLFLLELLGFIWLGWLGLALARSDTTTAPTQSTTQE